MSVQILHDKKLGFRCLFCNTTMWAFGGIFYENEDIRDFLEWLPDDARTYTDPELETKISEWRAYVEN